MPVYADLAADFLLVFARTILLASGDIFPYERRTGLFDGLMRYLSPP
jgi:hypothetical protein